METQTGKSSMMLLTKDIQQRLPKLGSQDGKTAENVPIIVKFFDPTSAWTWYVIEGEPRVDGDWRFFGLVHGCEKELGYFTLSELLHAKDGVEGLRGLPIERDRYFPPQTLADVQAEDA